MKEPEAAAEAAQVAEETANEPEVAGSLSNGAATSAAAAAEEEQEIELDASDVVAFEVATKKLKADPGLLEKEELSFFKDLIRSWGQVVPGKAPGKIPTATSPEAAAAEAKPEKAAEPAAPVNLSDSEEDIVADQPIELELPRGLLDEELAEELEPVKPKTAENEELEETKAEKEDSERLAKDTPPYPLLPPRHQSDPSDARKKVLAKVKQQAVDAVNNGDIEKALERYTEAIRTGGASALMLATRAALLLRVRRPCAAIRDCCAALQLNPDCGKAFHVRGLAHRKLGNWKKAHRDLSQGQKLDFSEDSVKVHMFVAKKVGVMQEQKTGRWYQAEGAKKAVELLFEENAKKKAAPPPKPSKDLRIGQAVRLAGLTRAPTLNGKRGIVQRLSPDAVDRWDIEIRLERGRLEVKSIKSENIMIVRAAEAAAWKAEEDRHEEERKQRAKEEKRWQEEEDRRKRMDGSKAAKNLQSSFPTMDVSERLEAEMSCLPLNNEAMGLLRRMPPQEALEVLNQLGGNGVANLSAFIKIKVKQRLGDPDSEEEPVPAKVSPAAQAAAHAQTAAYSPATASNAVPPPSHGSRSYDPFEDEDEDSDDEDFDRLQEESEATLPSGVAEPEPSEKQDEDFARWKQEALEALDSGDVATALARYTQVIDNGGSAPLMLAKRGELLLKERRPLAAIKDCTAALSQNDSLSRAFRVRGLAYRKLGRWPEAHRDLSEAQALDFDEGTSAVLKFVSAKAEREARKKRKAGVAAENISPAKRRKDS